MEQQDFDKLGQFYLGRLYDLKDKAPKDELLLYDSKDLVTHAVCVGMTGSGKTGLCIGLLEEAALDGIPSIVIDPKGDLGNLMLTFPGLSAGEFRPWINEAEAATAGVTPDQYAEQQAQLWTKGLADWGEDAARIERLRQSADFNVFTPGSTAGIPVSILSSFAAPSQAVRADSEALADRVTTTATSLLTLLGVDGDPLQSREHILVSTILSAAWSQGTGLDLAALIAQIQQPPFARVGVLDLESFFPSKERFQLAMRVNNLLAAPGFDVWLQGESLDIGRFLYTPEGKPRVSIFSIAHLDDARRMFFVSLLLNEILGWMRGQPGTSSLRAILYMDEIFGFFPPVAEPPSKRPLLTLLKQARAFGLGVALATQNPVDLDYKGLANAGTWFIGRLQTERDKARVLEGLEGVAAGSEKGFERGRMEEILAGLGKRVFLMYNAHEDEPVVFTTRWTMSYLRGPMTTAQIKTLMDPKKAVTPAPAPQPAPVAMPLAAPAAAPAPAAAVPPVRAPEATAGLATPPPTAQTSGGSRPLVDPSVPEYFLPIRGRSPAGAALIYRPTVLGAGRARFFDAKASVDIARDIAAIAAIPQSAAPLEWDLASVAGVAASDLSFAPDAGASFDEIPGAGAQPASYKSWAGDFADTLYRGQAVELLRSPSLKILSAPEETEGDFRARLQQAARELRDQQAGSLRQKYAPKLATMDERVRRAQQAVQREAEQAKTAGMQTAISLGATLLGAFMGRKAVSMSTLGRATTAVRGVGRTLDQSGDVGRANETVQAAQQAATDLNAQFQTEVAALETKIDPLTEQLETVTVRPKKSDIDVTLVGLGWLPHWRDTSGALAPAWL